MEFAKLVLRADWPSLSFLISHFSSPLMILFVSYITFTFRRYVYQGVRSMVTIFVFAKNLIGITVKFWLILGATDIKKIRLRFNLFVIYRIYSIYIS